MWQSFILQNTQMTHTFTYYCCTVMYVNVLYCTVLYCSVLCCSVLYHTILYCNEQYSTLLYCTIKYPSHDKRAQSFPSTLVDLSKQYSLSVEIVSNHFTAHFCSEFAQAHKVWVSLRVLRLAVHWVHCTALVVTHALKFYAHLPRSQAPPTVGKTLKSASVWS